MNASGQSERASVMFGVPDGQAWEDTAALMSAHVAEFHPGAKSIEVMPGGYQVGVPFYG